MLSPELLVEYIDEVGNPRILGKPAVSGELYPISTVSASRGSSSKSYQEEIQ